MTDIGGFRLPRLANHTWGILDLGTREGHDGDVKRIMSGVAAAALAFSLAACAGNGGESDPSDSILTGVPAPEDSILTGVPAPE
jgi:hypothetical protein